MVKSGYSSHKYSTVRYCKVENAEYWDNRTVYGLSPLAVGGLDFTKIL
jgi:hypothetical protein